MPNWYLCPCEEQVSWMERMSFTLRSTFMDEQCGYKYIISSDSLILRPCYNGSIICLYLMLHSCRKSLNFIWISFYQPRHIHSCQLPHFEVWESDLANVTTETNYTVKKYMQYCGGADLSSYQLTLAITLSLAAICFGLWTTAGYEE